MTQVLAFLNHYLQSAHAHVNSNDRYRRYPIYSALLALLVLMGIYWPTTEAYYLTLADHRSLIVLDRCAQGAALGLTVALGVVGLLRRGWLFKALALFGTWWGLRLTFYWVSIPSARELWLDFSWYAFELPAARLHEIAFGDTSIVTLLYAGCMLALYLALRPLLRRSASRVGCLLGRYLKRSPAVVRWVQRLT